MSESVDWSEYLAWTRGSDPRQYELTERLAWKRLQEALLRRRVTPVELRPSLSEELVLAEPQEPAQNGIEGTPKNPWGWPIPE